MPHPVFLVALLSAMPMADLVWAPGYLPMFRPLDSFFTEGDILIRAVTPLHSVLNQPEVEFQQPPEQLLCQQWVMFSIPGEGGNNEGKFKVHFVLQALGLLFAVAEAKGDPTFLPNVTVGLHIFDSCISWIRALGSTLALLSNPQPMPNFSCGPQQLLLGVVGGMTSPESKPMTELLSIYRIPQKLQVAVRPWDSCLAFSRKISSPGNSISSTARTIASSPAARVTVCDCYHFHFRPLAEALWKKNVTRRRWIFSTSFLYAPSDFLLTLHPAVYPGNSLVRKLWEELQGCRWPLSVASTQSARDRAEHCTGLENMTAAYLSIFKLSDLTATYQAYLAAKALLAAYQNLVSCAPGEGPFLGGTCASTHDAKLWQVLHYIQKVCFTTRAKEEVFLTKDGEVPAMFDIKNIYILPEQSRQTAIVGHFDLRGPPGKQLLITDSAIIWVPSSICNEKCPMGTRKSTQYEKSNRCYNCLPCLSGEISKTPDSPTYQECPEDQWPNTGRQSIPKTLDFLSYHEPPSTVLAVCMALLFLLALAILGIFTWHHHTHIIQANNHRLSYLLLASLALRFLCPFMCIGHPGPLTCAVCLAAFGVTFTVCVSTVLAKTISVVAAFHATQPNAKIRKVGPVLPSTIPIVCSLVQAALYMFWVIRWPPSPVNSTEPRATVTVMCHEGSLELFYAMLGYLGLLDLVSLLVAFPARRLPDTFNEAKHITLSSQYLHIPFTHQHTRFW
ncbi:LOW QUALITY PROTEIN: extracellular calcium-sensing receptor-like [Dugong dugon]